MGQPYIGEIRLFGGNFAPQGYALCNGQLLAIAEYDTLFNLIGTTYGGDGQNTFALPDFRGRIPVSQGQGSGLSNRVIGQLLGVESVALTLPQLPAHNHGFVASSQKGTLASPAGALPAAPDLGNPNTTATFYVDPGAQTPTLTPMVASTVGTTGAVNTSPHTNIMPVLAISFIISLYGVYPTPS